IRISNLSIGETPLNIIDRMGGYKAAFRMIGDTKHEPAVRPEPCSVSWIGVTGQDGAVASRQREAGGRIAGKFTVKIRKGLRCDGNHSDAVKLTCTQPAAAANSKKWLCSHARLQSLADISARVTLCLRLEIVAVRNRKSRRWECDRRNQHLSILVDDQYAIDRTDFLFELC